MITAEWAPVRERFEIRRAKRSPKRTEASHRALIGGCGTLRWPKATYGSSIEAALDIR